jgi:hypothetical protein
MTIRRAIPTCRFGERSVALGAEIRPDRPAQAGRQRFAPDSPVEGGGFELLVLKWTAYRENGDVERFWLAGWANYFSAGSSSQAYSALDVS